MKKSIMVIFFFNFAFPGTTVNGQACDTLPYQHIFYNKGFHDTYAKNFFFTSTSDIYLLGYIDQDVKGIHTDGWLMLTTFHGTPVWSKAIGTSAEERINSVKRTKDGGFMFVGSTKYNSLYELGWLAKVDSAGDPQWSFELKPTSGNLFNVEELDNGDYIVTGSLYLKFKGDDKGNIIDISKSSNFIMRIDKDGRIIWQRSFYHTDKERFNKIQQLADGNLVLTGSITTNLAGYILKLDQYNGNIIWMNQYNNPNNAHFSRILENDNGSFRFTIGNRTYFLTPGGKYKNGASQVNVVVNNVTLTNTEVSDMGPSEDAEIYFANIKPNPVVFSVKNNAVINWAHTYNQGNPEELELGSGRMFRKNIYLTGTYKTDNISDAYSNEHMAYLLRATASGETYCSGNFKIGFKSTAIATGTDTAYNWTDEGSVTQEFISLYSQNIEPVRMLDCSQQTCCNDILQDRSGEICDSSPYKLPDGALATAPGLYSSRFNTAAGCDSIIYTSLSSAKKISLVLTKDTCLINNMAITFLLADSNSVHYRWQDGTTGPQYTANLPGKYWVTATSACDTQTDSVNVHASCTSPVFIPSAFTPNSDGLNDVFRVPDINNQHLESWNIYNRFGQLIFHTDDPYKGWNGTINNTPQPAGTYIYLLRYFDIAGNPHLLKGSFVLIR